MIILNLFMHLKTGLTRIIGLLSKTDSSTVSLEEKGDYQMSNLQMQVSRAIALGLVLTFWCSLLLVILTFLGL